MESTLILMRQSLKFKKLKTLSRTYLVLIIDLIIFNKDFMIIIKMNVFFSAVVTTVATTNTTITQ